MIINEEFYKHHLQVVSSAIQSARSVGVAIHTVSLLHFELPYYHSWEQPNLRPLSESLRQLLGNIKVLRLHGVDDSVLELLSRCAFDLHQLDMCGVVAPEKVIKDFFETNKKSIRSIGFHDVGILGLNRLDSNTPLSASMLCCMLGVPQSTLCRAADCGCLLWRKEGWRLVVGDGSSQLSTATSAKRKYDEL